MKVFQGPVDVAWQASTIAMELRSRGIDAISLSYSDKLSNTDISEPLNKNNIFLWIWTQLRIFVRYGFNYDIYHFHFARTFLPFNLDLVILKLAGKKVVFHFHGCDIRDHNRLNVRCSQCSPIYRSIQQPYTKFIARVFANKVYISTPDLLWDFPTAEYLPLAFSGEMKDRSVKSINFIVHAPTDRKIKGSGYIISAAKKLKRFSKLDFQLLENLPHNQVKQIITNADGGVDQLLLGWYGMFSIELLAQGKPVLCYINPELKKYQKDLPILYTDRNTIYYDLKSLIEGQTVFNSSKEVAFVKNVHAPKAVVDRIIKDYQRL